MLTTETDNIIFGDFTSEECHINTAFASKYEEKNKSVYTPSVNISEGSFIIFGDFTPEECFNIQRQEDQFICRSVFNQTPINVYNPVPCIRCGYHSHTVDKCVARRNRYGELIWAPSHQKNFRHPSSPMRMNAPVYYNQHIPINNWCTADKTDYTQFVFSEEDVQDWIEEENHSNHFTYSSSRDPNLDYMLGYIQALTDHVLYRSW